MMKFRVFLGACLAGLVSFSTVVIPQRLHAQDAAIQELKDTFNWMRDHDIDRVDGFLDSMYNHFSHPTNERGLAEVWFLLAEIYQQRAQFPAAFDAYEEARLLFETLGSPLDVAKCYSGLGMVEGRRGNMTSATEYLLLALEIYERENDQKGLGKIHLRLGVVHVNLQNYEEAIDQYNQALDYALGNDTNDVITLYINLGSANFFLGEREKAIDFYKQSLDYAEGPEYEATQLLALGNLAAIYAQQGDLLAATDYYEQGIALTQKHQMYEDELLIRLNMTSLYQENDLARSIQQTKNIWKSADSLQLYYIALTAANKLVNYYKRLSDDKQVIHWMEEHRRLSAIRYDESKRTEIANLQSVYELKKSREDIAELREKIMLREKADLYFWLIMLLLALGMGVALYMNYKNRQINKQLRLRESELEEKDKFKDLLFSIVGHDLNGALATQTMALELLASQIQDQEEAQELLQAMKGNMNEVTFILDTLVHWGKKQINGVYLDQKNFEINAIVAETLEQLGTNLRFKNVQVIDETPSHTWIYADEDHFRFVLRNLMSNAVKYSSEGGVIKVGRCFEGPKDAVILYVRDEGVGIPDEVKAHVFEPDISPQKGTQKELGHGIALTISRDFMVLNKGKIWFEDNRDAGAIFNGSGTTFFHQWPAARPQPQSQVINS